MGWGGEQKLARSCDDDRGDRLQRAVAWTDVMGNELSARKVTEWDNDPERKV